MATSNPNGTRPVRSDVEDISMDFYMMFLFRGPMVLAQGMAVVLMQQTVAYKAYKRRECKH